jgi:hypothetical protein
VGRAAAIPPRLEGELLARAAEGWSSRRIAAWLKAEHGVSASHSAVARHLKGTAEELKTSAKAKVRDGLVAQLDSDLAALKKIGTELAEEAKKARGKKLPAYLAVIDRQLKAIDLVLHYSGAGEPDPSTVAGVVVLPPEDPE